MEGICPYHGTREELLSEIDEVESVVHAQEPLHEDPLEDLAIRGIWGALLESLLLQREQMDRISGAA
jgi:hypothetical protein